MADKPENQTGDEASEPSGLPLGQEVVAASSSRSVVSQPASKPSSAARFQPGGLPTSRLESLPKLGDEIGLELPRRRRRWGGPTFLFIVVVLAPFCGLYYYLYHVASPQYVTEFRFSVMQIGPVGGTLPAAMATGPTSMPVASLASAMSGGGVGSTGSISPASPQNYIVVDYLKSRQVVDALDETMNLREMYSKASIDPWFRLKRNASPEELVDYWKSMVSADYDMLSGIASASVKAFSPTDALEIGNGLVSRSEKLVNQIEGRALQDAIKFSKEEVDRAQHHLESVRKQLADFRAKNGVIDPTNVVGEVTSNVNLAQNVSTSLSQALITSKTLLNQKIDKNSSLFRMQAAQVAAAMDQLDNVQKQVAKSRDGKPVLSKIVSQYEALDLDRQYAQALLLNAYQALDRAHASANSQQLYLTPYVRPALPGSATGLHSVRYLIIAAFGLTVTWLLLVLILRAIRRSLVYSPYM